MIGESIIENTIIGEVQETRLIVNKIMNGSGLQGELIWIVPEGNYKVTDVLAKVRTKEGDIFEITMIQKCPVRVPRGYKERLITKEPLLTGQRVIDTMFPIAKGGMRNDSRRIWNWKNDASASIC